MSWFESFVKRKYLKPKNDRSIEYAKGKPRASLPIVGKAESGKLTVNLANAINAEVGKLKYNLDPFGGLLDFYNHPEFTQWRHEQKAFSEPCDCDDFAYYAKALIHLCGVDKDQCWIWNITPGFWDQFTQAKWNHVLCGFSLVRGNGEKWTGIIDTNSAAQGGVFWFIGSKEEAKPAILKRFKSIYPANYAHLIESEFVF